jgi:hypothetical protein
VGYFFDYDVTKILEDLPFAKLERLMNRGSRIRKDGRGVFPVDYGPYQLDYLPRKEFKVRKGNGPWVVINDVGPFFQCRFVEALRKWKIGTEDELRVIEAGKDMRGNFEYADLQTIDTYNRTEIVLLEKLMEKFRDACTTVGLQPAKWQGPGQLAKALMQKHGVPRSKDVPLLNDPDFTGLMEYGRKAFYGGRPELPAIGPVNRPVYQKDINSAYPAAMLSVPCLMHGGWSFEEYGPSGLDADKIGTENAIVFGTFSPRNVPSQQRPPMLYGLPFRSDDGTICYPGAGKGWYWNGEIRSAVHQSFRADSAWVYDRNCSCSPLEFIGDEYLKRLALGKDDAGIALKLALNSVYGIAVQSIGKPEYANPVWGSYITSWCRTKINDFIHSSPSCQQGECGRDILMIATDSVATWRRRDDVPDSKVLGEWSTEVHPRGMFLIQPGLYFGSSGGRAKTRGVPLAAITEKEDEFRSAFDKMVESKCLDDGDVRVPQRMFVGIRYALHRRNQKLLGQWIDMGHVEKGTGIASGKTVKFDWTTKRLAYPVIPPGPSHSYIETFPQPGDPNKTTTPYSKDIGGVMQRELLRLALEAQPEWAPSIEPGEMNG